MSKSKGATVRGGSLKATVERLVSTGFHVLFPGGLLIGPNGELATVNEDGSHKVFAHIADARRAAGIGPTVPVEYHHDGNLKQ